MPSITSWMRLEPEIKREGSTIGLQARIHDPLWLLGRQWQLGEFNAEDAGSPVKAQMNASLSQVSRYHVGRLEDDTQMGKIYDPVLPLETLVEREVIMQQATDTYDWRLAADAGMHLLRILDLNGLGVYRKTVIENVSINIDPDADQDDMDSDTAQFLLLTAKRAPDGIALYHKIKKSGLEAIVTGLNPKTQDKVAIRTALMEWQSWYESLYSEPDDDKTSWMRDRLEYEFSVAANIGEAEYVLTAPEYNSGDLDWYAFDENASARLGANNDSSPNLISRAVIPAPVSYKGMPAARWWEFEDAQINFGAIETDSDDVSRLVFLDFVMNYSNDWFVIPLELPLGSLCELTSLVVTDTFGLTTTINPYAEVDGADSDWQLFRASAYRQQSNQLPPEKPVSRLFVPPVLSSSLHSKPIEEVLFLRDEMANMAWAVEKSVEGGVGQNINRLEAYLDKLRRNGPEQERIAKDPEQAANYHLTNRVPDYWVPLLPVQEEDGRSIRLQRGKTIDPDSGEVVADTAKGRILDPEQALRLYNEEVPRSGKLVKREWQYSRWHDGSTHVWIGRRVMPGKGEGASGLRFDIVEEE